MSEQHPDLSETDARQGRRGRHVLMVLVISLALIVIAFTVIWLTHNDKLSGPGGQTIAPPSAAEAFNAPEPAPIAGDEATPTTPAPPAATEAEAPAPSQ